MAIARLFVYHIFSLLKKHIHGRDQIISMTAPGMKCYGAEATPNIVPPLTTNWRSCVANTESTLHQISPYIGKIKSSISRKLINSFSSDSTTIFDPFCGSGTVALEGWFAGRNVIAADVNSYAVLLAKVS
jgi:Putative RNA methylase family UPF0020